MLNLRRSTRKRQKPFRFRDDNVVTSGTETSSGSDGTLLKMKRFLAKKNHNGNIRYISYTQSFRHFTGHELPMAKGNIHLVHEV